MALTSIGKRILCEYVGRIQVSGRLEKLTINAAVKLTLTQQKI